jgi:hypothetical protein
LVSRASKVKQFVVTIPTPVEFNAQRKPDPNRPVLYVELDRTLCEKQVDIDAKSIVQVTVKVSETDAHDRNLDTDPQVGEVNIASDLFIG